MNTQKPHTSTDTDRSIREVFTGLVSDKRNSSLCIFASFTEDGEVFPYVARYLESLHGAGFDIIFVQSSNSAAPRSAYDSIAPFCRFMINRRNIGYDFYSWKVGLGLVRDLSLYDELLITNDSIVGPFNSLSSSFDTMRAAPKTLWGMTDSFETGTHHLQSYFIFCNRDVFSQQFFSTFWDSLGILSDKSEIIVKYEIGFSQAALSANVPIKAVFPYEEVKAQAIKEGSLFQFSYQISSSNLNSTLHAWDILLARMRFPFIKSELLRINRLQLRGLNAWKDLVLDAPSEILKGAIDYEEYWVWNIPKRNPIAPPPNASASTLRRRNPKLYDKLERRWWQAKGLARNLRSFDIAQIKAKVVKVASRQPAVVKLRGKLASAKHENPRVRYFREASEELDAFFHSDANLEMPPSDGARVTIILILFNKAELTYRCLLSLAALRAEPAFKVLIVDNSSSDRTRYLLNRVKGAEIVFNRLNSGFLKACNQAAELVTTEEILFLNNDTILYPGAIRSGLEVLSDQSVGAVGGRIVLPDGRLQEAGNIFWNDGTCVGYGRDSAPTSEECMFRRDVDYCSGVFLMTRSELFKRVGGFDLRYLPAYYEESDYCAQLQKMGLRIVYDPRILVKHVEFGSAELSQAAFNLMTTNRVKFLEKNSDLLATKYPPGTPQVLARSVRSAKKKWLFIDDRPALPIWGAGYPRMNRIIKFLRETNQYDITIACTEFFDSNWSAIHRDIPADIEVLNLTSKERRDSFFRERLECFDVVWVSRPSNMEILNHYTGEDASHQVTSDPQTSAYQNKRPYTLIYDSEAIFGERAVTEAAIFNLDQAAPQARLERELTLGSAADVIVAVCPADAAKWQKNSNKKVVVIGLDAPVQAGPKNFADRKGLLFLGSLHDPISPNTDSLCWFMRFVMPILRERVPDIHLTAIGYATSGMGERFSREISNFTFAGAVDDLRPYLETHRLMVVPTRYAAGIPQKVFDAATTGIPTVCSELIGRQMEWSNGVETLIAPIDEPSHFAEQCIALYTSEDLWNGIYERSLESIRRYSADHTIDAGVSEVLGELVKHYSQT